MPSGRCFNPALSKEPFAGLVFVPSFQKRDKEVIFKTWSRLFTKNSLNEFSPKVYFERFVQNLGRVYNGHTALMCGVNNKIDTIVGWDPSSALEAAVKSFFMGYGMSPVTGSWRDDRGMESDPFALFYGVQISEEQVNDFRDFITRLIGCKNFGPVSEEAQLKFMYAFKPADWMKRVSVLENNELKSEDINVIANCGDAAFHVLVTFLYEWRKYDYAGELTKFVSEGDQRQKNFSQGLLMRWATTQNSTIIMSKL